MFAPGSGPKMGGGPGGGPGGFGGSRSGGGGITIKSESGMSHYTGGGGGGGGSRIKSEVPEPVYPEEQEDGERAAPRVDIEHINLVTDDEGSDGEAGSNMRKGKGKAISSKGGLRPVRLHREEHKERVTILNTEPAATGVVAGEGGKSEAPVEKDGTNNEDTKKILSTGPAAAPARKWHGAWKDADDEEEDNEPSLHIKPDPETPAPRISDVMEIDSASVTPAVDSHIPVDSSVINDPTRTQSPEAQKKKSKSQRKSSTKDKKPVLQTEEDKAEYARHLVDIQVLSDELGGLQTSTSGERGAGDAEGDVEMENQVKDKEGRLYLFQFPPILPPLRNPIKREEKKEDVDMEDVDLSQVPEMDPSTTTGAGSSKKDGIDLTKAGIDQEETIIKNEPGAFVIPAELITEEGFIGKLVVRKSGKVELNWGGTSLQLGRGAEFEFLTTTLIVEEDQGGENGVVGNSGRKGVGTGMGRVMGKFVATPDWSRLF
jgi:DNA-directed RNA polymerase III subunit RPC4